MSDRVTGQGPALRHLDERIGELRREAEALISTLDETTADVTSTLRDEIERRPYGVLAAAAAVGYVLGGGLPSPLTRLAVLVGGRLGAEYLSQWLSGQVVAASTPKPD